MRATSTFVSLFLTISLAAADLVPAIQARAPETRPEGRSLNKSLGKRQFCPIGFDFCIADNGDAVCQSVSEVCCQLKRGTDPYTCPLDHPYCCGADISTGILLCGSDSTCGSSGFFNAPPAVAPTQATGTAAPKQTAAHTAAEQPSSITPAANTVGQPTKTVAVPKVTGAAVAVGGHREGIAAAVLAAGVAVLL